MDKRTREAVRYLGYGNHAVDEDTLLLIESSFQKRRINESSIAFLTCAWQTVMN